MEHEGQSLLPWLRQLSRLGLVQLTPRTLLDVERLLRLPLAEDPEALGAGLASLLAKDQASWRQIDESFRRWRGAAVPVRTVAVAPVSGKSSQAKEVEEVIPPPIEAPAELRWVRRLFDRLRPRTGFDGLGWRHWVGMLAVLAVVLVQGPVTTVEVIEDATVEPTAVVDTTLKEGSERELPITKEVEPPPTGARFVVEPVEAAREIRAADRREVTRVPAPAPPWTLGLLLAGSVVLAWLASRWWTSIAAYREDRVRIEQRADGERRRVLLEARRMGVPYHVEVVPPLSPETIEDAATLLGRLATAHPGWELDVPPTIARTIEAGGRVRPVYRPAGHRTGIVVLVDVESGDHPDLYRVNRLLAQWQRGGLELHRYDFRERPEVLEPRPHGVETDLAALTVRHEDAPLVVISRWARAKDHGGQLGWLAGLSAWRNRVWLDPDPRPLDDHGAEARQWRAAIAGSGLPRFPFTEGGLLACARTLAAGGEHAAAWQGDAMPPVRVLEPALRKWAACAWVVPDPVWAQLDAIRRRLPELQQALPEPGYVHRLIEWLQAEAVEIERVDRRARARPDSIGWGERLKVCDRQRRALAAWLREHDAGVRQGGGQGLEEQARRLVLEQLRAADVEGDPFEAKKRALKIEVHEAVLDPRKAKGLVKKWAHTAMADELKRFLDDERWLQRDQKLAIAETRRWGSGVWEVYEAWESGREGARLLDVLRPQAWTAARVKVVAAATAVVVGSYVAWGQWGLDWPEEVEREVITRGETVVVPGTWVVWDEVEEVARLQPELVRVPGGVFEMGAPEGEEGSRNERPQHEAEVESLEVCRTEVTQAQWKAVMGTEPFYCAYGCGDEYPAQNVSWNDAVEYMNRLTERENALREEGAKLTACYEREGGSWAWVNRKCTGYRLPTETEWEYVARAGTTTAYGFGDDAKELGDHAWYSGNAEHKTHAVAQKKANPWGLYDVHGNVWEWVWDWYVEDYPSEGTRSGYAGPATGEHFVLRGGSFRTAPSALRSANRDWIRTTYASEEVGFRCVRVGLSPELSKP